MGSKMRLVDGLRVLSHRQGGITCAFYLVIKLGINVLTQGIL